MKTKIVVIKPKTEGAPRTVCVFGKDFPLRDVIIVKVIVCVGILGSAFLPAQHAVFVSTVSNMLWLWRT